MSDRATTDTAIESPAGPATDPRFPVGPFRWDGDRSTTARRERVAVLAALPEEIEGAVAGLSDAQLDTPYRDGGWTVRQLVHHVADSHMNASIRFRLGLTEEQPTIRPYDEKRWAELPDSTLPVQVSLDLLRPLHRRWVALLDSITDAQFSRVVVHPEMRDPLSLDMLLALYAWHSRHHVAHVRVLRSRRGW